MYRTKQEMLLLREELAKTEKQDEKRLRSARKASPDRGVSGRVREKIPEKAMDSLESAFEKGFTLLFTKGDGIIEKMGGIGKAREDYAHYAASLNRMIYADTIKAMDKAAGSRTRVTKGTTTMEGSALGVFGMGLPDIPIFLAMLLKTAYEIGAGYGFDYRRPEEKRYALSLLNAIFTKGEEAVRYSSECDAIGDLIDREEPLDDTIYESDIREVSQILATDLLVAKFVQGFTFIGVIGGPLNYTMVHKVAKVAKIKYRKRFLNRLLLDATVRPAESR